MADKWAISRLQSKYRLHYPALAIAICGANAILHFTVWHRLCPDLARVRTVPGAYCRTSVFPLHELQSLFLLPDCPGSGLQDTLCL